MGGVIRAGRRWVELLLWAAGLPLLALSGLVLWNLRTGDVHDIPRWSFLLGAVMYGGPGALLVGAAVRMRRRARGPS